MKLKVTDQEETFSKDSQLAYKDGTFYEVLISERNYSMGNCLGKVRVIVDGEKVLLWVYPLMSGGGDYELLDAAKIEKYRKIVSAYDQFRAI